METHNNDYYQNLSESIYKFLKENPNVSIDKYMDALINVRKQIDKEKRAEQAKKIEETLRKEKEKKAKAERLKDTKIVLDYFNKYFPNLFKGIDENALVQAFEIAENSFKFPPCHDKGARNVFDFIFSVDE